MVQARNRGKDIEWFPAARQTEQVFVVERAFCPIWRRAATPPGRPLSLCDCPPIMAAGQFRTAYPISQIETIVSTGGNGGKGDFTLGANVAPIRFPV